SRSSQAEAERLDSLLRASHTARADDERVLRELELRLNESDTEPVEETSIDPVELIRLTNLLETTRAAEVDARLAMRTAEERLAAVVQRAEQLEKTAQSERIARSKALERREQRRREAYIANAVFQGVETAMSYLENSLLIAEKERDESTSHQQAMEQEVQQVRHALRDLASELERLVDTVHRDEVARMEQRLRIEQMEIKALEDYGIDSESLLREYGPDQLVPQIVHIDEDANPEDPIPTPKNPEVYVREKQEKRALDAEKKLSLLGRINPLALEEFQALEERNQFLTEQLEDVKKTRKDLLSVIAEVEERVQQVFNEAYKDVSLEFEKVLPRLFPGGEGRLSLTDPDNMLTTGIDIEVKPAGKRYLKLSLLSGGEKSLAAVAFLVALFKARPSPFYILDEVEAALDDANLGRLLVLYEELRENSQLIVITHQKRTMEICDALYGISMRGDGISTVVSQRLREVRENQPA
ncbi:MAG: AAA family ATPase, partial [Actinomycetes bacterium]